MFGTKKKLAEVEARLYVLEKLLGIANKEIEANATAFNALTEIMLKVEKQYEDSYNKVIAQINADYEQLLNLIAGLASNIGMEVKQGKNKPSGSGGMLN